MAKIPERITPEVKESFYKLHPGSIPLSQGNYTPMGTTEEKAALGRFIKSLGPKLRTDAGIDYNVIAAFVVETLENYTPEELEEMGEEGNLILLSYPGITYQRRS